MPVDALLALLAALAYGSSDFMAGLASRRMSSGAVTAIVQLLGLLVAGVAVLLFPGAGPTPDALGWGAASGLGSALGTLALYRGLAVGRMTVVATVSAVLTASLPAVIGLATGDDLSPLGALGIGIAVPAIALVCWQPDAQADARRAGVVEGVLAGVGFALLFIALAQAGTRAGAWPLVPGQAVALLAVLPAAVISRRSARYASGRWMRVGLAAVAGILAGAATLAFLAATGRGQLAVVAVLAAFYPAITILLARVVIGERWSRLQTVGLLAAAAAVALISTG